MKDIIIDNLSKSYGETVVFNNYNLTIHSAKRTAITAPSGYGKTTLIKMIAGLEKPDSGEISGIDGRIAFVFQEDRLLEEFSVNTNIRFSKSKSVDKDFVDKVLTALKIEDVRNKSVKKLSGGMKRRVAIARALCSDFDVIIMDEPFKGLDIALKDEVIDFLDTFLGDKTLILVTHDITDAQKLGCQIIDCRS